MTCVRGPLHDPLSLSGHLALLGLQSSLSKRQACAGAAGTIPDHHGAWEGKTSGPHLPPAAPEPPGCLLPSAGATSGWADGSLCGLDSAPRPRPPAAHSERTGRLPLTRRGTRATSFQEHRGPALSLDSGGSHGSERLGSLLRGRRRALLRPQAAILRDPGGRRPRRQEAGAHPSRLPIGALRGLHRLPAEDAARS